MWVPPGVGVTVMRHSVLSTNRQVGTVIQAIARPGTISVTSLVRDHRHRKPCCHPGTSTWHGRGPTVEPMHAVALVAPLARAGGIGDDPPHGVEGCGHLRLYPTHSGQSSRRAHAALPYPRCPLAISR